MEIAAAGIAENTRGAAANAGVAAFRQLGTTGRQEIVVTIDARWVPANGAAIVNQQIIAQHWSIVEVREG